MNFDTQQNGDKLFVKGKIGEVEFIAGIDPGKKNVYWVQEPKTKASDPEGEKDCPGCKKGLVGLFKRMASGGLSFLKSELGLDVTPDDEFIKRKHLCITCPHHDFGICTKCGCVCAAKTLVASECCPLTEPRWTAVTIESHPLPV